MAATYENIISTFKTIEAKRPFPSKDGFMLGVDSLAYALKVNPLDLLPKLEEMQNFGILELSHKNHHNSGRSTMRYIKLLDNA